MINDYKTIVCMCLVSVLALFASHARSQCADINSDGNYDTLDAIAFVGIADAGLPEGDWNNDASINADDVSDFLAALALAEPCPAPAGACCYRGIGGVIVCDDTLPDATTCTRDFRGSWTPGVSCSPELCDPIGACCVDADTCMEIPRSQCTNGTYQGPGTQCSETTCVFDPTPGACCPERGACLEIPEFDCFTTGGNYRGPGSTCAAECPDAVAGACCLGPSICLNNLTQADCSRVTANAVWSPGLDCAAVSCQSAADWIALDVGACCDGNAFCNELTSTECGLQPGSTFFGAGTDCQTEGPQCLPQPGACCLSEGGCTFVMRENCDERAGDRFLGGGVSCQDARCPGGGR